MHRLAIPLLVGVLLAACESDSAKLERLESDMRLMCLAADQRERVVDEGYVTGDTTWTRMAEEARQWRSDCTLADRELRRFLD